MIKVLIVDDQSSIRNNLEKLLSFFSDITIVGLAQDGDVAVVLANERHPDVVLMDIRMPVRDGISATKIIREKNPQTRVLILTTFVENALVAQALQAGATGYLLKDTPPEDLAQAIRATHKGYGQIAPQLISNMVLQSATSLQSNATALTKREQEVLALIATGASNQEIADILLISLKTVKNHVTNILSQLGLRDRTQAALYAQRLLEQ